MQSTVEHKYSIGDFVYAAELKDDDIGINIVKYRITGVRIISHCEHAHMSSGWTFEPADFEVSYTAVRLGVDVPDNDIIFREAKLSSTPQDALNEFMDQLRENTYGLV